MSVNLTSHTVPLARIDMLLKNKDQLGPDVVINNLDCGLASISGPTSQVEAAKAILDSDKVHTLPSQGAQLR